MRKINNHGDLIIYPIKKKTPIKSAKKAKLHILQSSSTTGNRHEVITKKGFIYKWEKDEKKYLHCDTDYIIRHIGGDCEHGEQIVSAGTSEIKNEMEHDPWKNELRRVID